MTVPKSQDKPSLFYEPSFIDKIRKLPNENRQDLYELALTAKSQVFKKTARIVDNQTHKIHYKITKGKYHIHFHFDIFDQSVLFVSFTIDS